MEPQAAAQVTPEDVEDEPLLSSSEERFVMYPVRQVPSSAREAQSVVCGGGRPPVAPDCN